MQCATINYSKYYVLNQIISFSYQQIKPFILKWFRYGFSAYKGVIKATERACLMKSISCEDLKKMIGKEFDIQLCETCQSDKCNSRQFDPISRT